MVDFLLCVAGTKTVRIKCLVHEIFRPEVSWIDTETDKCRERIIGVRCTLHLGAVRDGVVGSDGGLNGGGRGKEFDWILFRRDEGIIIVYYCIGWVRLRWIGDDGDDG